MTPPQVTIYTDASVRYSYASWGAIMSVGGHVSEHSGMLPRGINSNVAEVLAIVMAMGTLPTACDVTIKTDSDYAFGKIMVDEWVATAVNHFPSFVPVNPTHMRQPATFTALFGLVESMARHASVSAVLLKAHSGDALNERCDKLAGLMVRKGRVPTRAKHF